MHSPVNHPLRPVYRVLGLLAGLYLVVFGVVGIITTSGDAPFAVGGQDAHALGQGTNLAWSVVALVAGAAVLIGSLVGRNIDVTVDFYVGWGIIVVGTIMLALIRTPANIFNFSILTVVVSYIVGLVIITVGLYSKVAPPAQAGEPRQVRERQAA